MTSSQAAFLTPQDILAMPHKSDKTRIPYGLKPSQYGDLYLPKGSGPHSLIVVLHGGCWMTMASLEFMAPFCDTLVAQGYAVWNLEYRRLGEPGGGWPGTFQDVGQGLDCVHKLAKTYPLDVSRVTLVGHSSGGHLALWATARPNLPKTSPLYVSNPLPLHAAINIAGTGVLKTFEDTDEQVCGQKVISKLVGGDHYKEACPSHLLPTPTNHSLIAGENDKAVPPALMQLYVDKAKDMGQKIEITTLPNCGHFEFIAPGTGAHKNTVDKILEIAEK